MIVQQSFGHLFLFEFAIVMLIVSRFLLSVVYCVLFIVLYQLSHIIGHESLQPLSWIFLITSSAYSENGNCPLHKESDWKEAGYHDRPIFWCYTPNNTVLPVFDCVLTLRGTRDSFGRGVEGLEAVRCTNGKEGAHHRIGY
ncbi:uncharacterized protein LOC117634218 [Prunus dulcis]|uniref:uncharacterized protein LOC117634218 n=1 Tax=Prunus dulcis TaxID=3755 RepID=UPI00148326B5|nr:uncharacterized protein LOC117634218 [Prunus dulcis]